MHFRHVNYPSAYPALIRLLPGANVKATFGANGSAPHVFWQCRWITAAVIILAAVASISVVTEAGADPLIAVVMPGGAEPNTPNLDTQAAYQSDEGRGNYPNSLTQLELLLASNQNYMSAEENHISESLPGVTVMATLYSRLTAIETSIKTMTTDLETKTDTDHHAVARQDRLVTTYRYTLILLVCLLILAIIIVPMALLLLGRSFMKDVLNQCKDNLFEFLAERSGDVHCNCAVKESKGPDAGSASQDPNATNTRIAVDSETAVVDAVHPNRSAPRSILPPDDQITALVELAGDMNHINVKPQVPEGKWNLALATVTGNVRGENQDYGLCFTIAGHNVLVVADGCGGIPHGQDAAYLAVLHATLSIIRTYGTAPPWYGPDSRFVAAEAIQAAERRLAIEANKMNLAADVGLRTTLIVVIGGTEDVGYAYIGDGGACIIRSTGTVEHFLQPQKGHGGTLNILAASLGPLTEGEPVVGSIQRQPGDLLIIGTDGVFDRVGETFAKDMLRVAIEHDGDLERAARQILSELAEFEDEMGYVCDDNMTLALMGCCERPALSPGFWNETADQPQGPDQQETSMEQQGTQKHCWPY